MELQDIIDVDAVQSLMSDFYQLTQIGMAIVSKKGDILVKEGWQDICTKFHRVHPLAKEHCLESDTELSKEILPNTYKLYKCKNNMWDIATPIIVGDKHLGNLFLGQFFFHDEEIDYDVFRAQAQKYGFNEEEYLKALHQVPRWSREKVNQAMGFYTKLANMISLLSYSNIKRAQLLSEKDKIIEELQAAEKKLEEYSKDMAHLYQRLVKEMDRAQEVHQRNLPTHLPTIERLSFAAYYQPAKKLGGDFYDIIPVKDKIFLYLSDVSGSGIDSAMLSLFIKHTIKGYLMNPAGDMRPTAILKHLSNSFRGENYPEEYFICIFLGVLDLKTLDFQYTGAGFQDRPLVSMGNGKHLALKCKGLIITPLFPPETMVFIQKSIQLSPGTTLLLNTDGLTEQYSCGEYYRDRLPQVFYENADRHPSQITQAIVQDFQQFNQGSVQGKDDITFLVLQIHKEDD